MRILLVLGTSTGGVGAHVASLARQYARGGHTVGVIGPRATQDRFGFDDRPRVLFAPLDVGTSLRPDDLRRVADLRRLITSFRADAVHAHGFRASLLTAGALRTVRRADRPVFVSTWHNAILSAGARAAVERRAATAIARTADVVLGVSPDLVDLARECGARKAEHMWIPTVDAAPGAEDVNGEGLRRSLAAELGLSAETRFVLTIGRIAPQKGYPILLDASALWKEAHPEIVALAVGGGDEALDASLRARVADEGLPARFLGSRSDVPALIAMADAVVVCSLWEGSPLSVQEAMRSGAALIATAVGGIPEIVGDAGILIPASDPEAVADAVVRVAEDSGLRRELQLKAAARAAEFPDEAETAQANLAHYSRS